MVLKHNDENNITAKKSFDDRDLDHSVIEKSTKDTEYEAKMIAQFNAKVNNA